ncbi:MAG: glycosyltransferase family 2 protein [Candidatus Izemoplasmatales bacterium]|nr:glycosyltransferase family 2 protein [Candidatus Izemoplasmatales bacterium]MDD3865507.1 glycosyltransferase family 2 protein [Candidatus Izemoplasmatales bacterium]
MKQLTIIIPAYNEETNIRPFYDEACKYLTNPEYEFKLLFINDGSRDDTLAEIKKIAAIDKRVIFLSFSRNFGKESAMHAGLEYSRKDDAIIIIDCDLQQPPSLIPEMLKWYSEGYKVVYTRGKTRKGEPKVRTLFANLYYGLYNKYSDRPLDNGAKDFQLLDKQVVEAILSIKDNFRFMKGLFSWVGFKRKVLEYDFIARKNGKSSWSFKSLFKYGFDGMNQFSNILMVLPVVSFVMGIIMLGVNIVFRIVYIFSTTSFMLALLLNLLWLMISVLAYGMFYLLYQIRRQTLNRPLYLIEETSEEVNYDESLE